MATSLEILRPTPSTRNLQRSPVSSTTDELEHRSVKIARNDASSSIYLASDFLAEDIPKGQVLSVNADVDEERGKAKVWLLLSAKMREESVMILSWRRERGSWRCYRQSGMRGVSGFKI